MEMFKKTRRRQPQSSRSQLTTLFGTTMFRTLLFLHYCTCSVLGKFKLFESKKKRLAAEKAAQEMERLSKLVVLFGKYEFDRTRFYAIVSTCIVLFMAFCVQVAMQRRETKSERRRKVPTSTEEEAEEKANSSDVKTLDVIVVGCGLPKRGMGWFHLMQFLQMPNVNVRAVVEPYYLDETQCPHPPTSFLDLVATLREMDIECVHHVSQLESLFQQQQRHKRILCLIAGRTNENPRFFRECLGLGATHVYLEIPGAPSVGHLQDMKSLAETRGVQVYMGYQKLTSSYIEKAVDLSRSIPKAHVFFCHNDCHPPRDLSRVISRHPEGMLRSMASQELAVLVTQYGVKAKAIDKFKVNTNRLFSEKVTFHNKSNGKKLSDYSRVAFKITTKTGQNVSVMADQCGGIVSFAVVKNQRGQEIQRFSSHEEDQVEAVELQMSEDKAMMHQFIVQSEEYLELKKRVVWSITNGGVPSTGVASIQDGIDVMVLADYCTTEINAVLKSED